MLSIVWNTYVSWCQPAHLGEDLEILYWFKKGELRKVITLGGTQYLNLSPPFFIKFLFLTKWQPFKNFEKCFLFHLKSSFCSGDIQIFVFPSFPLFLLVSHCLRDCSKINLKVYDMINCLNKRNDKCFNNCSYSLFFIISIFLKHLRLVSNILKW